MSPRFSVAPLPGQSRFGALVTGLRQADLTDEAVRTALYDLFVEAGVIVVRGLDGGADAQVALSGVFGDPQMHPLYKDRPGQHATLIDIVFDAATQELYEIDGELRGGWLPWHSDLIYTDKINRGGVLRPLILPARGGETGFIDRIAAWALLPDGLKERCQGLNVIYYGDFDPMRQKFGARTDVRLVRASDRLRWLQDQSRACAIHPLTYVQAETGRLVLNFSPWFAVGVEDMETAESDALLADIAAWCTHSELAYYHRWRLDEMVVWDNWRMNHCATGVPVPDARHMQRTTIAGDYGLGRMGPAIR